MKRRGRAEIENAAACDTKSHLDKSVFKRHTSVRCRHGTCGLSVSEVIFFFLPQPITGFSTGRETSRFQI